MRFLLLGLLLTSGLAHGELGTGTSPAKAKTTQQKPAGYRTSEQDKQYQDKIDGIDKGYKKQTDAINDGNYENYLGKLDSTYDQMVNDINKGGSGRIAGELPKFVPTKVPDGTPTGTATTAATTSATTTASTTATSSSEEYGTPQERLIKSYCPNTCAKIQDEQRAYACKTDCVHSAMMINAPKPQEDNMMLMMLLASSLSQ